MKLQTKAIHAGVAPRDANHGSVVCPIHQTAAFHFPDTEIAAGRFALTEEGPIYARMGTPTSHALENRMAAFDDGMGAAAFASGMAAITSAVLSICRAGDNIVTSPNLYGGVSNLFANTFEDIGIEARFVEDHTDPEQFKKLTDGRTRLWWGETLPNPRLNIFPIHLIAKAANEMGIPLAVDNTCATAALCNPFEHGAHISVYSLTKYVGGHGNAIGGMVIDGGSFDWVAAAKRNRIPILGKPDHSLNGENWVERFEQNAYLARLNAIVLRDFGACMAPMNAFLFNQGLETLPLRMKAHCQNAHAVAKLLSTHPKVADVRYPALAKGPSKEYAETLFKGGLYGPMVGMELKGGAAAGRAFVEHVNLFCHVANIGDTRSMAIHPASTTHSQVPPEERAKAGIPEGYVRLCIGIEDADDLWADAEQALDKIPASYS